MKKLILSAAIVLGSFSSFAQGASPDATKEVKEVATTQTVIPETKAVTSSEEYKMIKTEEVPAPLNVALETSYPGATIILAHVNEAKEYKLEIAVENRKATVYSDAEGNWIQK